MGPRSAASLVLAICSLTLAGGRLAAQTAPAATATAFDDAQRLFYSARFEDAASAARDLTIANPDDLAAWELRTSALHFQLRRLIGNARDKKAAFARCAACGPVLDTFLEDTNRGRAVARARLEKNAMDDDAQFFLGKMDLSYLWLQLSTLDRKTGWNEYWEAKRLLEAILEQNPMHVRARVARAWMDYIVGTRVPWGTRWVMGGGNRDRGLKMVREAAQTPAEFYVGVEARFGLLEMLTREGQRDEALVVAKELLEKFPENRDLIRFIENAARSAST
jgi:tetratricopeptide (TPR) repeat protein